MTRRFLNLPVLALAFLLAAQNPLRADATNSALAKSAVLENDVAYLRVGEAGKNLADKIRMKASCWVLLCINISVIFRWVVSGGPSLL